MLPPTPLERLTPPRLPAAPARTAFPLAATLAPVIVSLGIWVVTGSAYSLLFAALGPVVALGSLVDGRRQRRRVARRDRDSARAGFARVIERADGIQERERSRLDQLAPGPAVASEPGRAAAAWSRRLPLDAPLPVRLGLADVASVVDAELGDDPVPDGMSPELAQAIDSLRQATASLRGAPWLVDARDGIGLLGPPQLAGAVARSLAFQLAAQSSPASTSVVAPADERWVSELPHAVTAGDDGLYRILAVDADPVVIAWGEDAAALPPGLACVIRIDAADGAAADSRRFHALGAWRAAALARRLHDIAEERGLAAAGRAIPDAVQLAELLALSPSARVAGGLPAPVGRDSDGVVELDLVRDGPHAVVAGTTGTGKSELLVSWVLSMAARHPPDVVTFLLIDFKGGAAFAPLAGLPHVVGIVSDLDARRSRRAIESLRAELRRRETLLAERGARSIDELSGAEAPAFQRVGALPAAAGLARLVIVVDEFAAVVSGQPELHEVFADLAARGRSLGLHLVLCTQRPAGVIRDGVLANIALRISLRVTDRGDSVAMLGSDAASRLAPEPRGRAVIADGSGRLREVQLAIADRADADQIRASTRDQRAGGRDLSDAVWHEPLPDVVPIADIDRQSRDEDDALGGIPFGRLDLPAEQRQPVARYDQQVDGHLLVIGGARSGTTNALAVFARAPNHRVLPADPADAWSTLDELQSGTERVARSGHSRQLLIIDDLDVLIDGFEPDARHEFVERLMRLAREARELEIIAGAQRLTGPLQRLAGLFGSRLLLRQPSRDEHVLAGGDGATFESQLPPGAGTWRGMTVQVALSSAPLPEAADPVLDTVRPGAVAPLAIVAGRPREIARALAARGIRTARVGEEPVSESVLTASERPLVLLGDPDVWQAEWSLLNAVRREHPIVFTGCSPSELRAIARTRDVPPPLGTRAGECWLVENGEVRRAILELES